MAIPKERKAPIIERHFFPKGAPIIREGEKANCAYLILSGRVAVFTEKGEKRLDIAKLEAGEVVGEMALFNKVPRTASVEAVDHTNLMVLTRSVLVEKMRGTDPTIQAIFKMMMNRISAGNEAMTSQDDTIGTLASAINEMFLQAMDRLPEDKRVAFRKEVQPILREFTRTVEGFAI